MRDNMCMGRGYGEWSKTKHNNIKTQYILTVLIYKWIYIVKIKDGLWNK